MRKINARSCEIVVPSHDELESFLNENHKQKYAKSLIEYGLSYNGELVQILAIGRPRFNRNYQYELIRDCTRKDCLVRGGLSKLWKHFLLNNNVYSCICYSYPHSDVLITNKYVDFLGFKNIKRASTTKKIYFDGIWNDKYKRIDKSLLERYGVDALLNVNEGIDRTNEQILLDLGFSKREEDGLEPQVDIYFPFGIVYRVDDVTDGTFYIGQTEHREKWDNGYLGSGTLWKEHLERYPHHDYKRTVILNANTPSEMFKRESYEISKYAFSDKKTVDHSTGCMNIYVREHGTIGTACPECGSVGLHKKTCSKATICSECGSPVSNHLKTCSNYNRKMKHKKCEECGATDGNHKKWCSNAIICPECGGAGGHHKKSCKSYKEPKPIKPCTECGATKGHKKGCSKYRECICSECGGKRGRHKKTCSLYKPRRVAVCSECGGKSGNHKPGCSKYVDRSKANICPECGGKQGKHLKGCSKYKVVKRKQRKVSVCTECGGKSGNHKIGCSKYVKRDCTCKECGTKNGRHKKWCSKYVNRSYSRKNKE